MYLRLVNFKCFHDADIQLGKLTVLAGANGNGKSTCIQALLFLRQTIEAVGHRMDNRDEYSIDEFSTHNIPLNGKFCLALGDSGLVLNKNADGPIQLGIHDGENEMIFSFLADNREPQLWLTATEARNTFPLLPIRKHQFYYLNAERLGPRVQQAIQYSDFPNAGWQGEFTAQLLDREKGYWKIDDDRKFDAKGSNYLNEQVNHWLGFIIPGTRVTALTEMRSLSGQILLENQYTTSEPTLATNLGFGISYVLPIIVTGLVAEKGSLLIIENPEAHLHPSAQSKIGQFLCRLTMTGINVVIETHSDHIINGIQIATAKGHINNELVTINYFSHDADAVQPNVLPILLGSKGELSNWPSGFFDQSQIDYSELFKLRKEGE